MGAPYLLSTVAAIGIKKSEKRAAALSEEENKRGTSGEGPVSHVTQLK
jgi:hypothetical protein